MEDDSHHSSNHFCFNRDEIGHLTRECIIDRLIVMTRSERNEYEYSRFFPNPTEGHAMSVNPRWRASICKWSYNVTGYFDLSREVVAISMNIFDRFFATRRCICNSGLVLLVSIATLHIAIKVRESAVIRLETLCRFSRGHFTPSQITRMELLVLTNLTWLVNPPTATSFVAHLLLLIPADEIDPAERQDLFESARFLAELSVADSFFIDRVLPSVTGLAAIMMSLDDCETLSREAKAGYFQNVTGEVGILNRGNDILIARNRLRLLRAYNEE